MNISQQSNYAPLPLFLAAALFILASPIFWIGVEAPGQERSGLAQENKDLYLEIIPTLHYGFSRLREGELPLWNDRQLCGVPFFAHPTHGLLQPLNAVFLFFDTPQALALHAFMALALMGFFFVLYMRSMGVLYIPAALGGIVYMCCGAAAAAMSRPNIANALVWMPLLCWVLRIYIREPRLIILFAGSIILSLLWLSGSPPLALAITGFCSAYAVGLVLFSSTEDSEMPSSVSGSKLALYSKLLLMVFIAVALSCIQWLPTLIWALKLNTPTAYFSQFTVAGIMPGTFRALLEQVLQMRCGVLPMMGYVGISTVLLLPVALMHTIPRWERIFFVLSAGMLWGAAIISGAGVLIYPASFSVAVLACLGADRLFAPRHNTASPHLWRPLVLVTLIFLILFVLAPAPARGRMLPFLVSLLLFALFRRRWASALSGIILVLFLFVDLNTANITYHSHPFFDGASNFTLPEEMNSLLRNTALDDRVLMSGSPAGGMHSNTGMFEGFREAGGTGYPLTTEQTQWWQALQGGKSNENSTLDVSSNAAHALLLNIMAVRAVAASENGGLVTGSAPGVRLRRKGEQDGIIIYENETALPRLSWVSSWHIATDMPSVFDILGGMSFNPHNECVILLEESAITHLARTVPDSTLPLPSETTKTQLMMHLDTPEKIIIKVENVTPGILVLSDTYASEWQATANGQRVPILKVNGLFRGVALGPGAHTIIFEYKPAAVLAGAVISGSTLLLLALSLLLSSRLTLAIRRHFI
ncbi:MAG: YfhO family protein [Candidatus Hydrogenedentes bacterium]|nr:YfhO family protein [Candidatus Hydrogenedentota bacterium]